MGKLHNTATGIALSIALTFIAVAAQAQITMSGTVKNEKGDNMVGAYVSVDSTTIATLTDLDGKFTLTIPDRYTNNTVSVNYAGYITETIFIAEGHFAIVMRDRETQSIHDIQVSTQKRLQRTVEIPIALSVIDSAKIRQNALYRIDEISHVMPGFNIIVTNEQLSVYGIRGVTSEEPESYGQSRISVFMDGVSISRIQNANMEQYDMEQVVVARGPQGTLFGRGAELGAVQFVRNKPTDEFEASLSVMYGTYNHRKAVGVINTPVGNAFSNRFAFEYNAHDGYIKNDAGGRLNGQNTIALRNSSSFHLGSNTDLHLVFDYQRDDNPGNSYQSKTQFNSYGEPIETNKSPFSTANLNLGNDLYLKRNIGGALMQLDFNGDQFEIHNTAGFRAFDSDELFDIDGTGLRILEGHDKAKGLQASEEFRVNWKPNDRFNAFAGASFFYEHAEHTYIFSGSLRYIFPLVVGRTMRSSLSSLPEQILDAAQLVIDNWNQEQKANVPPDHPEMIPLIDDICNEVRNFLTEGIIERIPDQLSKWFDVIYWEKTPDFYEETVTLIGEILTPKIDEMLQTNPQFRVFADPLGGNAEAILKTFDLGIGIRNLIPYSNLELDDDHYEDETDYNHTNEASVFAEFDWNFVQNLHLTLGIRGTHEKLKTGYFSSSLLAPMLGSIIYTNTDGQTVWTSKSYTSWVGRVVLNWLFIQNDEDKYTHNLYLSASRGRRPGMVYFNYKPDEVLSLKPETTYSYELGLKGSTKYGHLSYAIACYYYDWQNFQSLVAGRGAATESGSLTYVSDDNGKAYGTGVELSGVYTFNPNISIFADFSYTGGTFADKDMNNNIQSNSGNIFQMTPRYTFDTGLNWKKQLSGGKWIYFNPSLYTQSEIFFDASNNPNIRQGAFALLNANAGIQWTKGRISYDLGIYANNITNTKYLVDAGNAGEVIGLPTYEIGAPGSCFLALRMSLK